MNVLKTKGRGGEPPDEEASPFDRRFKYAVIALAILEFFAIALAVYHKAAR